MNQKILLVSDLDDTLLGDDMALARFRRVFDTINVEISIAYASGRFFPSIKDDIRNTDLPEPVAVIGGVGSEIHSYPEGELDQDWVARISNDWCAQLVRNTLADEAGLKLQPEQFQSSYKVSYFLFDATPFQLELMQGKLRDARVKAILIYSSNRDLDVLPGGVNKGTAAAFLAQQLGFSHDQVLVAGDSGNDLCMYEQDFLGIVVGNGHRELKALRGQSQVHIASLCRADGVAEGLQHWLDQLSSLPGK